MYRVFFASCGAVALMLVANNGTFARSGAAARGGFAAAHPNYHPFGAQSFRHRRGNFGGAFWPGVGDYSYGPWNGEAPAEMAPPASGDIHYTYTYDVPWDWAHRFPPAVTPSDRPYVPSCPSETVTVPARDGSEQTVNIMRCY